ncbi:hypothetical protein C8F04DRAFT_1195945 [Mycena alexandri]|uniref:Uncharacterized protein n=1 Tax=Mycena alexandri TaxID=1745969 RepID=A0AAD6S4Z5_9AGAR|nr:hypothetical protein C8F04DRAFT_1195945 [Mycena alexandri]
MPDEADRTGLDTIRPLSGERKNETRDARVPIPTVTGLQAADRTTQSAVRTRSAARRKRRVDEDDGAVITSHPHIGAHVHAHEQHRVPSPLPRASPTAPRPPPTASNSKRPRMRAGGMPQRRSHRSHPHRPPARPPAFTSALRNPQPASPSPNTHRTVLPSALTRVPPRPSPAPRSFAVPDPDPVPAPPRGADAPNHEEGRTTPMRRSGAAQLVSVPSTKELPRPRARLRTTKGRRRTKPRRTKNEGRQYTTDTPPASQQARRARCAGAGPPTPPGAQRLQIRTAPHSERVAQTQTPRQPDRPRRGYESRRVLILPPTPTPCLPVRPLDRAKAHAPPTRLGHTPPPPALSAAPQRSAPLPPATPPHKSRQAGGQARAKKKKRKNKERKNRIDLEACARPPPRLGLSRPPRRAMRRRRWRRRTLRLLPSAFCLVVRTRRTRRDQGRVWGWVGCRVCDPAVQIGLAWVDSVRRREQNKRLPHWEGSASTQITLHRPGLPRAGAHLFGSLTGPSEKPVCFVREQGAVTDAWRSEFQTPLDFVPPPSLSATVPRHYLCPPAPVHQRLSLVYNTHPMPWVDPSSCRANLKRAVSRRYELPGQEIHTIDVLKGGDSICLYLSIQARARIPGVGPLRCNRGSLLDGRRALDEVQSCILAYYADWDLFYRLGTNISILSPTDGGRLQALSPPSWNSFALFITTVTLKGTCKEVFEVFLSNSMHIGSLTCNSDAAFRSVTQPTAEFFPAPLASVTTRCGAPCIWGTTALALTMDLVFSTGWFARDFTLASRLVVVVTRNIMDFHLYLRKVEENMGEHIRAHTNIPARTRAYKLGVKSPDPVL